MLYIIDANNLAGKMGLIEEKDFDKLLIGIIKEYGVKENEYVLVFDGSDTMGDKYIEENITVIYAPRDEYCKSADDKIVEILGASEPRSNLGYPRLDLDLLGPKTGFRQRKIAAITDDAWLKKRIEAAIVKTGYDIKTISSSLFAEKIERKIAKKNSIKSNGDELDNEDNLSEDDVEEINEELLKIWQKK